MRMTESGPLYYVALHCIEVDIYIVDYVNVCVNTDISGIFFPQANFRIVIQELRDHIYLAG